jgi:hypothetical protein
MKMKIILLLALTIQISPSLADDGRIKVQMPDKMINHMLANMRDHLVALEEITRNLANEQYEKAADIAEHRLGVSSLERHGASHMAKFMPKEMASIGTSMHQAASRFARLSIDAELDGGLNKAFAALSDVMQQCVACHSSYKVH